MHTCSVYSIYTLCTCYIHIYCMYTLQVIPKGAGYFCAERSICFSPIPAYSPSKTYLDIGISNKKPKVSSFDIMYTDVHYVRKSMV